MRNLLIATIAAGSLSACSWFGGEPTRSENPVVQGVNYIGMSVSDLDQSTRLYSEAVDLQLVEQPELNNEPLLDTLTGKTDTRLSTRLMKSANAQLRFMQFEQPSASSANMSPVDVHGPGIAHVCFQVAQKTKAYQRFLDNGATHIGDREMVHLNPKRPVYYAYARDTDGILFEVEHVDIAALELDTPPKNDYRIRHVSLATSDMDRSVDFYKVLLETENPRRIGRKKIGQE